jgi:hypothetical protein
MEEQIKHISKDLFAYKHQALQFDSEIDNMLDINDLYQESIFKLEGVIAEKDQVIKDHMKLIG